ncbi:MULTISPECIES: hypothetical protein [Streptomyces]
MQMTEAFAATVAAVAPVIVLVGVVEMDQRRKIVRDSLNADVEELVAVLGPLPDQPTGEQVSAARARLEALPRGVGGKRGKAMRSYFMAFAWALVVFQLVVAEAMALVWLTRPEGKPETAHAMFCLATLIMVMSPVMV